MVIMAGGEDWQSGREECPVVVGELRFRSRTWRASAAERSIDDSATAPRLGVVAR
jgi:hypothetical protein